jgi:hypothetical protein
MATWNAAFNASPAGGDNPSQGDDKIREFKVAVYDRVVKEHNFDLTEGGAQPRQGLHKAGSAVAFHQASAPTQRNGVALGANDAGLIWVNSTTGVWYRWSGSAWVAVTVTTAEQITSTVATGTAPLVVASTTLVANLNASQLSGYTATRVGNGYRYLHGYKHGSNVQKLAIFSEMGAVVASVVDWVPVSGSIGNGAGVAYYMFIASFAYRAGAHTITLYGLGYYPNASSPIMSATSIAITDSDTDEFDEVSLAW